jgi:hypothetical protein
VVSNTSVETLGGNSDPFVPNAIHSTAGPSASVGRSEVVIDDLSWRDGSHLLVTSFFNELVSKLGSFRQICWLVSHSPDT